MSKIRRQDEKANRFNKGLARLFVYSALLLTMLILNLAVAMAYVQSHNLSELRVIDKSLDMYNKNITNISKVGIGTTNPSTPLQINGTSEQLLKLTQDVQANTVPMVNLTNFDGGNTDKDLDFGVYGGSSVATLLGVSMANKAFMKATVAGLVIGTDTNIADALIFSVGTKPMLNLSGAGGSNKIIFGAGNVGIGTSSPNATLHVVGTINATGDICTNAGGGKCLSTAGPTGPIGNINGSGASGYIARWNSTSSINNSAVYELNGNIGIGTTTPDQPLKVSGNINVTNTVYSFDSYLMSSNPFVNFQHSGSGNEGLNFLNSAGGQEANIYYNSTSHNLYLANVYGGGNIIFRNQSAETARIDSNGNVGIGTSTPSQKLEVAGNANISGNLMLGGANKTFAGIEPVLNVGNGSQVLGILVNASWIGAYVLADATNTQFAIRGELMNATDRAQGGLGEYDNTYKTMGVYAKNNNINAFLANRSIAVFGQAIGAGTYSGIFMNGNVGMGTESPDQQLKVVGNVNVTGTLYASNVSSNSPLQFQTQGTTRMYINDTNGNVGIGTTTPGQKLEVAGNATITNNLFVAGASPTFMGLWPINLAVGNGSNSSSYFGIVVNASAIGVYSLINYSNSDPHTAVVGQVKNTSGTTILEGHLAKYDSTSGWPAVFGRNEENGVDIKVTGFLANKTVAVYGNANNIAGAYAGIFMGGNVGIGTVSPDQKLKVVGNANVTGTLYASNVSSNSPLQFQTQGTTRIYVDDTFGTVGIGTTSPQSTLSVGGVGEDNAAIYGTGNTVGVYGNGSTYGMRAKATTAGTAYGVYAEANSTTSGTAYGVYGKALQNTLGAGVYGVSPTSSIYGYLGGTFGAYGQWDTSTYGQLGSQIGGRNYGVYASAASAGTNIGGYFSATFGTNNYGLIVENGNVGIGTSSPSYKLDINGGYGSKLFRAYTSGGISLFGYSDSGGSGITNNDSYQEMIYLNNNSKAIDFYTNGSGPWMRINSVGNVGIGTTNPNANVLLDVAGKARVSQYLNITGVDVGNKGIFADDSSGSTVFSLTRNADNEFRLQSFSYMTFFTSGNTGTEKMRLTEAGNVGIGTTNPQSTLSVNGPGTGSYGIYAAKNGASTYGIYGESSNIGNYGRGNRGIYGIANGTDARGGYFSFISLPGSTNGYAVYAEANGGNSGGINYGVWAVANSATSNYGVYGSGSTYDFYAGGSGTDYGTSSSIRWKRNIVNVTGALDKILALRAVYYDWDEAHGGRHDMGFIGEEVGPVIPEVVEYEPNSTYYVSGMDYGALTPMLAEAIKEQNKEIEELKAIVCIDHPDADLCKK